MTTRTLFLIRHAKSSWDNACLADIERPLNPRGLRDAPEMGRRLAARGVRPDLLLSSAAVRALSTARLIAETLGYPEEWIVVDERLYAAEVDRLLAVVGELDAKYQTVLLFGHNPELTALAHRWDESIEHMPTCAVAQFEFLAPDWATAIRSRPRLVWFNKPKQAED